MVEEEEKDMGDRRPPRSILAWGCLLLAVLGIAIGLGVGLGGRGGGRGDSAQFSASNLDANRSFTNSPSATPQVDSPPPISPAPTSTETPTNTTSFGPTAAPTIVPTATPTIVPTSTTSTAAHVPASLPIPLPEAAAPLHPPEPTANTSVAPPTNAPVLPPNALPVTPLVQSSSPTSDPSLYPFYSSGDGMDCQCRWYRQEFIVSENSDWKSLNQDQLQAIAEVLRSIQEISNPYPLGDRRLLRGRRLQAVPDNVDGQDSTAMGESYAYGFNIRVTSQGRLGIPGTGDFGTYMEYSYAFCNSFAAVLLPDYHEAFVEYASQTSQLQQFADAVAIPSLIRVTPPQELDRACQGQSVPEEN